MGFGDLIKFSNPVSFKEFLLICKGCVYLKSKVVKRIFEVVVVQHDFIGSWIIALTKDCVDSLL